MLASTAAAVNGNGTTNVLGGVAHQRAAGIGVGSADFEEASDGAVRRVPAEIEGVQSFAAATARASGVPAATLRSEFDGGSQWIDFPGPAGTIPAYSFSDVLSRAFNPALVRGRIVVVGRHRGRPPGRAHGGGVGVAADVRARDRG